MQGQELPHDRRSVVEDPLHCRICGRSERGGSTVTHASGDERDELQNLHLIISDVQDRFVEDAGIVCSLTRPRAGTTDLSLSVLEKKATDCLLISSMFL